MLSCSVIGLGKLGSPLAAVLADAGFKTIGVDINNEFVNKINTGTAPVYEPELQSKLDSAYKKNKIAATSNFEDAILATDISFLILPTPSASNGEFTNKYLLNALDKIAPVIKKKKFFHLINIVSTVMPGSIMGEIREHLEQTTGKTVGLDLGLCYNPAFIAIGTVVKNLLEPDFILIGQSDKKSGDMLQEVYSKVCSKPIFKRMSPINAELVKIAMNTFITTKITYANMISDICDRLPDANVDIVTDAVGTDTRIGNKYLKGRLGYAGPCFPRDNIALGKLAESIGARADLVYATDNLNNYQIQRLIALTQANSKKIRAVSIAGLAYKENTVVTDRSQGVLLATTFLDKGYKVIVHDPLVHINQIAELRSRGNIIFANTLADLVSESEVTVITTAAEDYKVLPQIITSTHCVIDCWRIFGQNDFSSNIKLVHLGNSNLTDKSLIKAEYAEVI